MKNERARSAVGGRNTERKPQLGSYRVEQRQIMHGHRTFHFVSYDGQNANVERGRPASPATWYLMSEGTRWEVMPQIPGEDPAETDRRLLEWVKQHIK